MSWQQGQGLAKGICWAGPECEGDDQVETEELWGCQLLFFWGGPRQTYHGALEVVGFAVLDGVGDDQHGEGESDGFDWDAG